MLAVAVTAMLAIAACAGDDGDASAITVPPEGTTSTTSRRSTTTTTDPDEAIREEVEQAYYEQWDAFVEIFSDPDPTNPLIDQHFTGRARELILNTVSEDIRNGHTTRRPEDPSHFAATAMDVVIESDDRATVVGCLVDGLVVVERSTGHVVNDAVLTIKSDNTFELIDGRWKLSASVLLDEQAGVAECVD